MATANIFLPKRQQGDFLNNPMLVRLQDSNSTYSYDRLKGWGDCTTGALANGIATGVAMSVQDVVFDPNTTLPPPGTAIVDWALTGANLYVVYANGWCYSSGRNDYGQLGVGDTVSRPYLKRIDYFVDNGLSVTQVWAGGAASTASGGGCVYFGVTGGTNPLYGCGANGAGNLGNTGAPPSNISTPAPCNGIKAAVVDVVLSASGGLFSAYVLDANKNVFVAGLNTTGQLGIGTLTNQSGTFVPATVTATKNLGNIASLTATALSALALDATGNVWTVGYNAYGQLGIGSTTAANRFTQVSTLTGVVQAGIGGGVVGYAYALTTGGELYTWGYNAQNNLFLNGATAPITTPRQVTIFAAGEIVKVFFPQSDQLSSNSQLFAQTSANQIIYAGLDNGQTGVASTTTPGAYKYVLTPQFDTIADIFVHGTATVQRLFVLGTTGSPDFPNVYACGSNVSSICNGGFSSNIMPANVDCALIPLGSFTCGWQ